MNKLANLKIGKKLALLVGQRNRGCPMHRESQPLGIRCNSQRRRPRAD